MAISGETSAPLSGVPTTMLLPPLRLDRSNYFFWRSQVLPAIRAHDLEDILLRRTPRPAQRIPESEGSTNLVRNPDFTRWMRLDQFLISWLLSSISESMIGHVVNCESSAEIWTTLEQLFNTRSKARMIHLMSMLQNTKKGSMTIDEYMLKMKGFVDSLRAAGNPVSEDQLILYILAGVGSEYESVVVNLTSRDHLSLQEVQYMLQNHEMRLEINASTPVLDLTNPMANLAQFKKPGQSGNNSNGRPPQPPNRGRGRGNYSNRGRGSNNNSRVICQLCGRPGHTVIKCYRRFDISYSGPEENSSIESQPQAYIASPSTVQDGAWYMDSGATNHMTSDPHQMTHKNAYKGKEKVIVDHEEASSSGNC
ncbi:hypothetical protein CsatB_012306 [Cannabis sativa]